MAMVARKMSLVPRSVLYRPLIACGGSGRALPLSAMARTGASVTGSMDRISTRVSQQSTVSSAYSTAATAAGENRALAKLRRNDLQFDEGIRWICGSRSLLRRSVSCGGYHRARCGGLSLPQNDERRRGACSRSDAGPSAGKGSDAALLRAPWVLQLAGLRTVASGADMGNDRRGKAPTGEPSGSDATNPPRAADAARPASINRETTDDLSEHYQEDATSRQPGDAVGRGKVVEDGAGGLEGENVSSEEAAHRVTEIRNRLRDARLDAREDARDWLRDKRDDMTTMQETLKDARREGRLRAELSDHAKEGSGRLQLLWRKYGVVGIGCYFGIYFGCTAFFYGVYDYGVMTNLPSGGAAVVEHMQEWMKHTPDSVQQYSDRLFGAMAEDHRARSFVLAWATCKVLEPLRLVASIAITPRVARALGRAPAKEVQDEPSEGEKGSETDKRSRAGGSEAQDR